MPQAAPPAGARRERRHAQPFGAAGDARGAPGDAREPRRESPAAGQRDVDRAARLPAGHDRLHRAVGPGTAGTACGGRAPRSRWPAGLACGGAGPSRGAGRQPAAARCSPDRSQPGGEPADAVPREYPSSEAERCCGVFLELLRLVATLAALSGNLERLRHEYRRTERRACALEEVLMPNWIRRSRISMCDSRKRNRKKCGVSGERERPADGAVRAIVNSGMLEPFRFKDRHRA